MIATERYADGRLIALAEHFREARIIAHADRLAFKGALDVADPRSGSALAEVVILVAVLVGAGASTHRALAVVGSGWEGREAGAEIVLSWAGEIARLLSTPLFIELVQQLRFVPVDFPAVLQLMVAAGVPLLAVVMTQIPLGDLVKWVVGSIF
jgi:hypothetical protein